MSVYLLDTDTLTLYQHENGVVLDAIEYAIAFNHTVGLPVAAVEEQMEGHLKAIHTARTPEQGVKASRMLARAVPLWAAFPIYPMTEAVIARYEQLKKQKLNVGRMDLRIAAIALEAGATIVTRNLRDFKRVAGLAVMDWSVA